MSDVAEFRAGQTDQDDVIKSSTSLVDTPSGNTVFTDSSGALMDIKETSKEERGEPVESDRFEYLYLKRTVSKSFRDFVLKKYPALEASRALRKFMAYLLFSSFGDESTGNLVLPARVIAEQFYDESYTHHFNALDKLETFRELVAPGFDWTDPRKDRRDSWYGAARTVANYGLDAEMSRALFHESVKQTSPLVDFVSGAPRSRAARNKARKKRRAEHIQSLHRRALNATQSKVATYLHRVDGGRTIGPKIRSNTDDIRRVIEKLGLEAGSEFAQYRILRAIQEDPNVYYSPSTRERSCRLYAVGETVLGLKREVRCAALKGWTSCDLRASQFAILAAQLQAPLATELIQSGRSLWQDFYSFTHGCDELPPDELKSKFKEFLYSLCFGKGKTKLGREATKGGFGKLVQHPIVAELLSLRKKWYRRIQDAGGAPDVWGSWQGVDDTEDPETGKSRRWAGAVAASVVQSVEFEIIASIFDVATEHGESHKFSISLFQHDGAYVSFQRKDRASAARAKLEEAVSQKARQFDVITVLEFKDL